MALVELLQQGWGVVQQGPPISEPITPWVAAVEDPYTAEERQRKYNTWLQRFTELPDTVVKTPATFKAWVQLRIAEEAPNKNRPEDYADLDAFIAEPGIAMMLEGGRRRRRTYRKRHSTRGSRLRKGGSA